MKDQLSPPSSRSVLIPLLMTVFIDLLGIGIAIPILAPLLLNPSVGILASDIAFRDRAILYGFLIASYPIAQFFGAPLLGALADRHGRKKLLLISLGGTFVGYILFAIGIIQKNIELLFISRILDGFTGGNISIAMSSISDVSTDEKSKTKNFGLIGMVFGLGFIIGPYVGGKLADHTLVSWFNYATPFWFTSILTIVNIVLVLFLFKETLRTSIRTPISLTTGIKNVARAFYLPHLRVVFIVIFLLGFGFNFFTQFFQVYLVKKFSFTESSIGDMFAYIGLWIAFAQGGVARPFSKKFNPSQILNSSIFLLGLVFLVLLVPSRSIGLYIILPFIAILQGLIQPNSTTIVSSLASKDSQGEILGINQSVVSLAQAIPPIVSGYIVSININLPMIVASLSTLLAGLVFVSFFSRKKKEKFHEV